MTTPNETVVYDVSDAKVYKLTTDTGASPVYGAAVDVPGIATVSLDPNFLTAELKGDAKIIAKKGRIDKFALAATYGKVSLNVLDVVMQGTASLSGATTSSFHMKGVNALPYFKFAFVISDVEAGLGDIHVTAYKCQLTGGTLVSGNTDQFGQPTMQIEAIPLDSNDAFVDIDFETTATALPA